MTAVEWIQVIAASSIPLAVICLTINRAVATRKDGTKGLGIGVRAIQFIAAATFMPGVIILALADKIDSSTVAALIGALIGYIFANISKYDER